MKSIKRILIANRGEIARRIIKTCHKLGITTISIYSDPDYFSPYVKESDESFPLSGSESRETYLNMDKIIHIATLAKVDAIHPGYGFLSENAEFAKKVISAGFLFIGPTPESILAMGDKVESRKKMSSIGVPVVPGYNGSTNLLEEANKMGYPVLIKASAGGGGRGMRKVFSEKEFTEQLESAKREAFNFFSNDSVFLEKLIINPRHIEVQIFGDNFGNHIHIYDRDCSIQRRNQKIIEEAPAPNLPDNIRSKLHEYAILAAKSINYINAGTVEFILDINQNIYFLEMNTRLQVEHPVTECITGLDLVELQIRIANGESLNNILPNGVPPINGSAIELRICAEEGIHETKPGTGRVHYLSFGGNGRLDSGVETGSIVTIFYDSMIAKLITHNKSRILAINESINNLSQLIILGIPTNHILLFNILSHESFKAEKMTTGLIESLTIKGSSISDESLNYFLCTTHLICSIRIHDISVRAFSDIHFRKSYKEKCYVPNNEYLSKETDYLFNKEKYKVKKNGNVYKIDSASRESEFVLPEIEYIHENSINFKNGSHIFFKKYGDKIFIQNGIDSIFISIYTEMGSNIKSNSNFISSTMPGKITSIHVNVGDLVSEGDPLLTIESMKMENILKAERDATIKEILFGAGSQITVDDILIKYL